MRCAQLLTGLTVTATEAQPVHGSLPVRNLFIDNGDLDARVATTQAREAGTVYVDQVVADGLPGPH